MSLEVPEEVGGMSCQIIGQNRYPPVHPSLPSEMNLKGSYLELMVITRMFAFIENIGLEACLM